jgi:molybdopterin converting factor small subunit
MSIKIVIPSYLQSFTNYVAVVEVNGSTIGGCLDNLTKQSPDIKKVLFAKNGELLDYVSIYVQGKDAYPEELAKPVKDGDEIHVIYIIAGG